MSDQIYTGALTAVTLQTAVESYRPQAEYGIVESLTEIDFPLPATDPIDLNRWPKGRIFSPAFELRWEQVEAEYRVVLAATEKQSLISNLSPSNIDRASSKEVTYYCWREQDSRLGRTLDYRCVPGQGKVKLVVREYRNDHGGLIFWRYVEMKREGETR